MSIERDISKDQYLPKILLLHIVVRGKPQGNYTQNMSISSRAKRKILEGSETRDTKVSPEHPPLTCYRYSDDIVRSSWKHEINVVQPYPYPGVADGISFSSANNGEVPASLRYMFKDIEETIYPGQGYEWNADLARWSNQGILMINIALTTTVNKVGQHYILWQPFLAYLFDILSFNNPGLVYVFMGNKAQEWMKSIPDNNIKLTCTHPASAAHNNLERWNSGEIFKRTEQAVQKHFNTKIIW